MYYIYIYIYMYVSGGQGLRERRTKLDRLLPIALRDERVGCAGVMDEVGFCMVPHRVM